VAVTTTPLGFQKPDGTELIRNGDNVIAANAQKDEDLHKDHRGRLSGIDDLLANLPNQYTPISRGVLADGTDLNTLTGAQHVGVYSLLTNYSYPNAPAVTRTSTAVLEVQRGGTNAVLQRLTFVGVLLWREAVDSAAGTWSAWVQAETTDGSASNLASAKAYADGKVVGTSVSPVSLTGTESLNDLLSGNYRVSTTAVADALGMPTSSHGFLLVQRNSASAVNVWTPVSGADPSIWIRSLSVGAWSAFQRIDAAARTDAVLQSIGPKIVALDADEVPYYSTTAGTLRIFPDVDGNPYYATDPWPTTSVDTDGIPYLTY
jgi:hypothetical protein